VEKFFLKTVLFFLLSVLSVMATTQNFLDPRDSAYTQLDEWQTLGYVDRLPMFRPYPVQVLIFLLQQVVDSPEAMPTAKALATQWVGKLRASSESRFEGIQRSMDSESGTLLHVQSRATALVDAGLGLQFQFDGNTVHLPSTPLTIPGAGIPNDFVADWSSVTLAGEPWHVFQLPLGDVALGSANGSGSYGQLGISRHSIGPTSDSEIILSSTSPATGHLAVGYLGNGWQYTQAMMMLRSTNNNLSLGTMDKYMYYHDLSVNLANGLEASFFEVVIGGGAIQPLYFLPLTLFFSSQGFGGFGDNSFIGFTSSWRFARGWKASALINMDDMHFNDMMSLQFNTKYKMAAQLALLWAGDASMQAGLPSLMGDYTAVTPYTYTHHNTRGTSSPNFEMYSNGLNLLGADLQPNSDRFRLKAHLGDLTAFTDVIRHGNASAGIIPGADGSITDPGYLNGVPTFQAPFVDPTGQPYTRFLTQKTLEVRAQAGFRWNGQGEWDFAHLGWVAGLGLSGEVVWNEGLVAGNTKTHAYTDVSFGLRW